MAIIAFIVLPILAVAIGLTYLLGFVWAAVAYAVGTAVTGLIMHLQPPDQKFGHSVDWIAALIWPTTVICLVFWWIDECRMGRN